MEKPHGLSTLIEAARFLEVSETSSMGENSSTEMAIKSTSRAGPHSKSKKGCLRRELQSSHDKTSLIPHTRHFHSDAIRQDHNRMEKMRRKDMRNEFDYLKDRIPALISGKHSSVAILQSAVDHIMELQELEQSLKSKRQILSDRHKSLTQILATMQGSHSVDGSTPESLFIDGNETEQNQCADGTTTPPLSSKRKRSNSESSTISAESPKMFIGNHGEEFELTEDEKKKIALCKRPRNDSTMSLSPCFSGSSVTPSLVSSYFANSWSSRASPNSETPITDNCSSASSENVIKRPTVLRKHVKGDMKSASVSSNASTKTVEIASHRTAAESIGVKRPNSVVEMPNLSHDNQLKRLLPGSQKVDVEAHLQSKRLGKETSVQIVAAKPAHQHALPPVLAPKKIIILDKKLATKPGARPVVTTSNQEQVYDQANGKLDLAAVGSKCCLIGNAGVQVAPGVIPSASIGDPGSVIVMQPKHAATTNPPLLVMTNSVATKPPTKLTNAATIVKSKVDLCSLTTTETVVSSSAIPAYPVAHKLLTAAAPSSKRHVEVKFVTSCHRASWNNSVQNTPVVMLRSISSSPSSNSKYPATEVKATNFPTVISVLSPPATPTSSESTNSHERSKVKGQRGG